MGRHLFTSKPLNKQPNHSVSWQHCKLYQWERKIKCRFQLKRKFFLFDLITYKFLLLLLLALYSCSYISI
ncbi:hypothetical protein XELAEV_18044790mg [Xenopus laevis]|uniref:Uncharacterized protein n=1 Tax=Xenopus laevis TaxID=8355 RepID=A0A974C028_XENLA|nr:hypothetical protein XELAEV_18044790mg [Xenopus laevis]